MTFTANTTPPVVTGIYANSTSWTSDFRNYLASANLGDATYGYKLSSGAGQLNTLPWNSVNQVIITFSKNILDNPNAFSLAGVNVPNHAFTFNYNSITHAATLTFASGISADKLTLAIASALTTDTVGNPLDGEWTDGTSTTSGNGTAGGNLSFHFNVLPADANGDGTVDGADFDLRFAHHQQSSFSPGSGDLNADGLVDGADFDLWFSHLQTSLPSGTPSVSEGQSTVPPAGTLLAQATTQPLVDASSSLDLDGTIKKSKNKNPKSKTPPTLLKTRLFH
jgi:hypothetical protein